MKKTICILIFLTVFPFTIIAQKSIPDGLSSMQSCTIIYAADDKVENLAAQMVWAVENTEKARKLGDLNKKRVEEVFSWNNSIKDTVKAFENLTAKKAFNKRHS